MIDIIGYISVTLGLFAATKKKMLSFRIWHGISCLCFIFYALLIQAYPIILSGVIFISIHLYNIIKIKKESVNEKSKGNKYTSGYEIRSEKDS